MKIYNRIKFLIVICLFFGQIIFQFSFIIFNDLNKDLTEDYDNKNIDPFEFSTKSPQRSIISGNELYAEQIQIDISQNHGLIHQALLTNDTNIFAELDLSDPAFYDSMFVIQFANKISSPIEPSIHSDDSTQSINTHNNYVKGFLFYNNEDNETIQNRKVRAIQIIEELFNVDLIFRKNNITSEQGFFFPFYGSFPYWSKFQEVALSNIPNDGYWQIFDKDRVFSEEYINTSHLSTQIVYMKNFSMWNQDFTEIIDDDLDIGFDLSMESEGNSLSQLLTGNIPIELNSEQSNSILDQENNEDSSENNDTELSVIEKLDNIITFSINYELNKNGISNNGFDEMYNSSIYEFNLFNALNYSGEYIPISDKIFNSFDGISLSTFKIGLFGGEPVDINPHKLNIDTNYLSQIEELLFLLDQELNISQFEEYSFKPKWKSHENYHELSFEIQNLENSSDFINLLPILNPIDSLMAFPSAFIEPMPDIAFSYLTQPYEPRLEIIKNITSGQNYRILEPENNPDIEIFITNPTNLTVWGLERNFSTIGIMNDPLVERNIAGISGNFFDLMGFDSDRIIDVTTTLGYDINTLFHNENPRFFLIDSNDSDIIDYTIPELINLNALLNLQDLTDITSLLNLINRIYPYSPEFTQLLIDHPEAFGTVANNPQSFNSSASIFNPTNWKLDPFENASITMEDPTTLFDSNYTQFFENFISEESGISPTYIFGSQLSDSSVTNSYLRNDGTTWDSQPELLNNEFIVQQSLLFRNTSNIPLNNYSIDALNITILFEDYFENLEITLEIFNFEDNSFEEIPNVYNPENLGIINITFPASISSDIIIEDYIDEDEDFSVLIRLQFSDSEDFQLKIDYFEIGYMDIIDEKVILKPSKIYYGTELGNVQYSSLSNSIILSTDDSPSIELENSISIWDNNNNTFIRYNVSVENVGNIKAENLTITIYSPGILQNITNILSVLENDTVFIEGTIGNYSIRDDTIIYEISSLKSQDKLTNLTFEFILPNSRLSSPVECKWNYQIMEEVYSPNYIVQSKQIYLSKHEFLGEPMENNFPGLKILYNHDYPHIAPCPGTSFIIEVIFENNGNYPIYGINFQIPQNLEGIINLNSSDSIFISELQSGEVRRIQLAYVKTQAGVYLLPQLNIISLLQPSIIHIESGDPLLLGNFSLELIKEVSQKVITEQNILEIEITAKNAGTIELANISINDIYSFDASGFELINGLQIHYYDCILPGEEVSFIYQVRASKNTGIYDVQPVKVEYWFIYKQNIESNSFQVMIRPHYWKIILPIIISTIIGIAGVYGFYRYKNYQLKEETLFERRENLYFGHSLRDVAWDKKNITAFLQQEMEKYESESKEEMKKNE